MTDRYDRFWAAYFGIVPALWEEAGVSITAHVGLAGYQGVWCFRRQDRVVVSAPPGWVSVVRARLHDLPVDSLMDESCLRGIFLGAFDRCIGPAFQGYLPSGRFRPHLTPEVRVLGTGDTAAMTAFRQACGEQDWGVSGLSEVKGAPAAYVKDGRIVSMAGYRPWTDDAGDPCILTDPAYRGRGCGTATAAAVVGRALAENRLVLYQTLEGNVEAVHLARRLGYEAYARHVAVRLKAAEPSNTPLQPAGG